jgi:hypothetical protein
MTCPYLDYRRSDGGKLTFDHERAYCRIQGAFVSPVKADICNDRGRFHHSTFCEIYAQHEASQGMAPTRETE